MVHTIQLATAGHVTGGETSDAAVKAGAGTHSTFNVDTPLQGGGQLLLEGPREKISTQLSTDLSSYPHLCKPSTSPLGGLHLAGPVSSFPPVGSACCLARLPH